MKLLQKYRHLLIAAILGAAIFICICSLEPLRYSGINWTLYGFHGKDVTSHQAGWMYYRNSPWSFPLCKASFLGYPEGTVISYTDSIPIVALFFKLLSPLLPKTFQYIGLYSCFCYMMQGLFASALLYLNTKNKPFSVIGSVFFVTASSFVDCCLHHSALSSHWLLLAALLLYFTQKKTFPNRRFPVYWSLLLCAALGIHPYLFAMAAGVFALSAVETIISSKEKLKSVLVYLACTLSVILFGTVIGLFGTKIAPEVGYGDYSLNLNALFNPYTKNHDLWSSFLHNRPVYGEQGDGMCYLGLPVMILAGISVAAFFRYGFSSLRNKVSANIGFLILCICYTVFALSDCITFDDHVIFQYPLPGVIRNIFNIFRSSNRFFFIPYYCIILFALCGLFRLIGDRRILCLCLCALTAALQIIEFRPGLEHIHSYFETRREDIFLADDWKEISERYNTARALDRIKDFNLSFWFAENGFRTDLMVTAPVHMNAYWDRTEEERTRLRDDLENGRGELDPDSVYIIPAKSGTNRAISNDQELAEYIGHVKKAWKGKAELLYLNNEINYYWILCPFRQP